MIVVDKHTLPAYMRRYKKVEGGAPLDASRVTWRFVDASVNHADVAMFLRGFGSLWGWPSDDLTSNESATPVFEQNVEALVGTFDVDLNVQGHDSYLILRGRADYAIHPPERAALKRCIIQWCKREKLPPDPLIWRLAGKRFDGIFVAAECYIANDPDQFSRIFGKLGKPLVAQIPVVGVMNIDHVRQVATNLRT